MYKKGAVYVSSDIEDWHNAQPGDFIIQLSDIVSGSVFVCATATINEAKQDIIGCDACLPLFVIKATSCCFPKRMCACVARKTVGKVSVAILQRMQVCFHLSNLMIKLIIDCLLRHGQVPSIYLDMFNIR